MKIIYRKDYRKQILEKNLEMNIYKQNNKCLMNIENM